MRNVEIQAIIGPTTTMEADFISDLGEKARVPVISFSATASSLSSKKKPYFIRAAQNDSSQVDAISALIKAFGWRQAVLVYIDNDFGNSLIPYLTDSLQSVDARVSFRSVIPESATDDQIGEEVYKLMTMETRVFIVHMSSVLGSRFFMKVKEFRMLNEGYVWILTTGLTDVLSSIDPHVVESSMQGLLGVKTYVPSTKELEDFSARWRTKFITENPTVTDVRLNMYGLWAYDAAIALARAVERIRAADFSFRIANNGGNGTDLETLGVSQSGVKLREEILHTEFTGLSGYFKLIDGQLPSSAYQIVNVIGNAARQVGFWRPMNGITRELSNNDVYSTNSSNLEAIIWPGESTFPPKGWTIPTSGNRLKIGVPVKDGFSEFVKVTRDSHDGTNATGYCIDVFNAVMASLPYAVPYDFIPFQRVDGKPAGTYNDLIYQVYTQKYDAVVGDTTITANRSNYVDFTLPYTESSISMIVPIRDSKEKNAWVFLKPLTWQLWITTLFFFILTGFVIWVLEHRINDEFRGPPSYQVGTMFWFSFSTMVFAHREKVVSNAARFVVVLWVFVVLILTQSYTANLTSMLTIQQLQPNITDVDQLLKNKEYVGYQQGSFVLGFLKRMNFNESRLRVYNSLEELNDAFNKGSSNGGIAAAFDEIPFVKLFLAKYCSKYTMIRPIYKIDGFGFAFPRGSPLVSDVSRAILQVTDGGTMSEIEAIYFGDDSCPSSESQIQSGSLDLQSFWGLFLIAGIASIVALIIFLGMFLCQHRHVWTGVAPETSAWDRISKLMHLFNQRDSSSHTFRRSQVSDGSAINGANEAIIIPSPSSIS